jgi:hypothetical protein
MAHDAMITNLMWLSIRCIVIRYCGCIVFLIYLKFAKFTIFLNIIQLEDPNLVTLYFEGPMFYMLNKMVC